MKATVVDFILTEDECGSYEKRLAERGMKVRPMSRETLEDLEKGGISHLTISGILMFEGAEYLYHVYKFPKSCQLTVEAFAHSKSRGKALMAEIGRVFPQSGRDTTVVQTSGWFSSKDRVIPDGIGCLFVLAFIGAVIFFAIMGFKSVFWK